MTGKDMLRSIQNLDEDLIEEAEFGTFQKKRAGFSGKKKLLLVLAAALIMGTMTAAAVYTRWSATMQLGNYGGVQPSERIKKQAEQSGLSVIPTETKDGKKEAVSATDNGITVTLAQTVMDQYGGRAIFRIEGLELEEGQHPWAWFDFLIDGKPSSQYHIALSAEFFNGITWDADGSLVYTKNGKPVQRVGENRELLLDYQLLDGSIEYSVDFEWIGNDFFGKEMVFTFTGFGVQRGNLEHDMTVPGKWELRWTLEGSAEEPVKWTPNAKIGDAGVTLIAAEVGQYSIKLTYHIDEASEDEHDLSKNIASIRLKDGTDIRVDGRGRSQWDPERRLYTVITCALDTVLDPSQIAGMSFYTGYERNAQGDWVTKPFCYVPFE